MDPSAVSTITGIVGATIGVVVAILATTRYLQRAEKPYSELERALEQMRHEIEFARGTGPTFTEADKEALMRTMQEHIRSETVEALLLVVESRVAEKYGDLQVLTLVKSQAEKTLDRLRQELFALSKRGNLNLAIGIVTTIAGLLLLGAFVLTEAQNTVDLPTFAVGFVPRISLVLLIEVFAYFFLRLYKTALTEIKYFQNEITSIEAKFLALTVAATSKKEDQLAGVLHQFARIERNFILEKGQTTVELERNRLDQQVDDSLMNRLADVLKKKPD